MEITQQLRDFASEHDLSEDLAVETGMQQKSAEFLKERKIYVQTK
tara:strand:- start:436 stop:570 length:135 start_codon:yes stop_codon:yes gene_type:complete